MTTIRPAKRGDLPLIKKLIARYPKRLIQKPLPSLNSFFVALDQEEIIGCCALEIYSQKIAEVRSLVVLPQYRGQGIGRGLVNYCLKRARRRRIKEVLAITGDEKLFKKLGFRTFNQQKFALFKILSKPR